MARIRVLIGDGGHARDIAETGDFLRIGHHSDYQTGECIIGVSDPQVRAVLALQLGVCDLAWVHPFSFVGPDCKLGHGTHVNYGVSMTRSVLGAHCTVSPGATICGDVIVGDRVLIGAGATICEKVRIGDDAVIGAGAVVLPGGWGVRPSRGRAGVPVYNEVPAGATWVGVPAREAR